MAHEESDRAMRELDDNSAFGAKSAAAQEPYGRDLQQEHLVPHDRYGNDKDARPAIEATRGSFQPVIGRASTIRVHNETIRTISVAVVRAPATSEPSSSTRVAS